jgi:hypothetical protein
MCWFRDRDSSDRPTLKSAFFEKSAEEPPKVDAKSIEARLHVEHHQFLETLILREKRKQERWEAIKIHVLGWAILGIIGSIGTAAYKFWIEHIIQR